MMMMNDDLTLTEICLPLSALCSLWQHLTYSSIQMHTCFISCKPLLLSLFLNTFILQILILTTLRLRLCLRGKLSRLRLLTKLFQRLRAKCDKNLRGSASLFMTKSDLFRWFWGIQERSFFAAFLTHANSTATADDSRYQMTIPGMREFHDARTRPVSFQWRLAKEMVILVTERISQRSFCKKKCMNIQIWQHDQMQIWWAMSTWVRKCEAVMKSSEAKVLVKQEDKLVKQKLISVSQRNIRHISCSYSDCLDAYYKSKCSVANEVHHNDAKWC